MRRSVLYHGHYEDIHLIESEKRSSVEFPYRPADRDPSSFSIVRVILVEGVANSEDTPVDQAASRLQETLETFKNKGLITSYSVLQKTDHGVSGMAYVPESKWSPSDLDPIYEAILDIEDEYNVGIDLRLVRENA